MARIYDPVRLTHPKLRDFAFAASWIATVVETANDLEDLFIDVPADEPLLPDFRTPLPWEFDSMAVALRIDRNYRKEAEQSLKQLLASWLGEDRENWPVLQLTLIDPWQEPPDIWSEQAPDWVRTLATIGATAHAKYDPFDRRPTD